MIVIENAYVKAQVNEIGAELSSVVLQSNGREYLWQGDAGYWPSRAPILFPVIGGTKGDTYGFEGTRYHLERHGFAAKKRFKVERIDTSGVELILEQDDETKQSYPFDFRLSVRYSLVRDTLVMKVSVLNPSLSEQYFSFGWHPGFFLEGMNPGSRLSDYTLSFSEKNEQVDLIEIKSGFRTGTVVKTVFPDSELILNKKIFEAGPLVLSNMASKSLTLASASYPGSVVMEIGGAPYVGLWTTTRDNSPFLCIEPWYGITDSQEDQSDFSKKIGIQRNSPGTEFSCTVTVSFK
jgi:galactose mutarotase-like enzyme